MCELKRKKTEKIGKQNVRKETEVRRTQNNSELSSSGCVVKFWPVDRCQSLCARSTIVTD